MSANQLMHDLMVRLLMEELGRERKRLAALIRILSESPQATCADALAAFVEVAFDE